MAKINVFISYAREDAKHLERLKRSLHEKFCPLLNIWDDGKIPPGGEWDDVIKRHLTESQIVLLLISEDFILSDYIENTELRTAIARHEKNECKVVPIFTRYCDHEIIPQSIKKLNGLPRGMRFLSTLGEEADVEYSQIRKELNDIAESLLTELDIANSKTQPGAKGDRAKTIEDLRSRKKIFLSIPALPEAKEKRSDFVIQAEGKAKYFKWPYEVVPGIMEMEEIEKLEGAAQKAAIASLLKECIYSIHLVATEDELNEGIGKVQYDLASEGGSGGNGVFKSILWLLSADLQGKVDKEFYMHNSIVSDGYGTLFSEITRFDSEKEREIEKLKKAFAPNKKVYLYYNFSKDHDNDLRIKLKNKIEDAQYCVRMSTPGEDPLKRGQVLSSCEGAIIFYGAADYEWFTVSQADLLDRDNICVRGVCLDEPEIRRKYERDVLKYDFLTIKGEGDLDGVLHDFFKGLNKQP